MRKSILAVIAVLACDPGDELLYGGGSALDKTTAPITVGVFQWANGTYGGGCVAHSGSWSVPFDGYVGAMTNPPLAVIKHNSGCVLTFTGVHDTLNGDWNPQQANFALANSPSSPQKYLKASDSSNGLYGSAWLTDATFASGVHVNFAYSNDPNQLNTSRSSNYHSTVGTATALGVNPPNYTLDMSAVDVEVDLSFVVDPISSGNTLFVAGSQAGELYSIHSNVQPPTIDNCKAWTDGTWATGQPIAPIPFSAWNLVGTTLPQDRYLVVTHTDMATGLVSCEWFDVTFTTP